MAPFKQTAALLSALVSTASAHGLLSKITADGTEYQAYNPSFQSANPAPEVIEWSCPQCHDNGFVEPAMWTDVTKIACHKDATAGAKVAPVKAGSTIDIQWTTWPESHKAPVIDYLAKVDDATTAKAADLQFFKIDQKGYSGTTWASDELIANNLTWTVTIPSTIANGQYVLRHEMIALHSAGRPNGAQSYPKCINIEVTVGGSANPPGVTADKLYKPDDAGITVNIYGGDLSGYQIPGPALFEGGSAGSNSSSSNVAPRAQRQHARTF
ncbi:glycoside hydrolase [Byssothecium circinans]|uniref:AA9 family lytic polysaccharide monooxygenase n=1 Tax=Byssothecium circinans TaxID=147558 RepID=A0A6A5UA02_9PLEO|nr:glycoside hydrolase [Byssothecium circinans]